MRSGPVCLLELERDRDDPRRVGRPGPRGTGEVHGDEIQHRIDPGHHFGQDHATGFIRRDAHSTRTLPTQAPGLIRVYGLGGRPPRWRIARFSQPTSEPGICNRARTQRRTRNGSRLQRLHRIRGRGRRRLRKIGRGLRLGLVRHLSRRFDYRIWFDFLELNFSGITRERVLLHRNWRQPNKAERYRQARVQQNGDRPDRGAASPADSAISIDWQR